MPLALRIQDLHKTYQNKVHALQGVNLEVAEGDFFALLGPNGAGKSTTIGIISSLVNKTRGVVEVFGYDLDRQNDQVKSCIGIVPQEFNFNQFEPVEEIVLNQAGFYGIDRHTALQRTEKYLRQLGLWEKRRSMARELSGGMKRRLMIARALVHEPRLLILDEPTAGVDIEIRRSMWDFLRKINQQGTTIILTTHYLEEAENLCKHIAIINNGVTIESTEMKTLLSRLHVESYLLNTRDSIQIDPQQLPDIPGCRMEIVDETTMLVEISKDNKINDVFTLLNEKGINVISMRNKSNRLEELFVRMVEEGAL